MSGLRDRLDVLGYRVGWSVVRRLPEGAARRLFDLIADAAVRRGAAARLRANYARVRPELTGPALDALTREGMRAYLRYFGEAFRLPDLGPDEVAARVRVHGDAPVRARIDAGGAVVAFLAHMGNWDLAGAWGSRHLGPVTTVAERLKPEEVFAEFLSFREGIGLTILPLTGGPAVFPALEEAARHPGIIPLLADRDLTRSGVEVDFCGHRARVAAGPAALALSAGAPLHPVSIRHERRPDLGRHGWGIVITFHEAVAVPAGADRTEQVQRMTQACVDVLGEQIRAHTADWHMLQRVFVDDLDPARGEAAA